MSLARATACAAVLLLALAACDEALGPRGTPCTEAGPVAHTDTFSYR